MMKRFLLSALMLCCIAGSAGATAPKGVFSVGVGVYVTLADENVQKAETSNLFQWSEIASLEHDGWRVLSSSEWTYLLVTRDAGLDAADQRNGLATVAGTQGLIIIPDYWTQPSGVSPLIGGSSDGWNTNIYDAADWTKMSAAGAVFLPADGYGYNDGSYKVENVTVQGNYWSSTPNPSASEKAYVIQFEESTIHNQQFFAKTLYYSVRLAQTVTVLDEGDDASTFSTKFAAADDENFAVMKRTLYKDGYFNTLCLPFDVSSIAASPLADAEVYTFEGGRVVGTGSDAELQLRLAALEGDRLDKGVPYMIRWASGDNLTFMIFDGIAWGEGDDADQTGDENVKFQGFYPITHIEEGNHYNLFLGADDTLYWPEENDETNMKGFRAYWAVDHSQPSPVPIRRGMRASLRVPQVTGIATGTDSERISVKSEKQVREGRVVLLINGEQYSIGGQKL